MIMGDPVRQLEASAQLRAIADGLIARRRFVLFIKE
jgi:hypothetical protein